MTSMIDISYNNKVERYTKMNLKRFALILACLMAAATGLACSGDGRDSGDAPTADAAAEISALVDDFVAVYNASDGMNFDNTLALFSPGFLHNGKNASAFINDFAAFKDFAENASIEYAKKNLWLTFPLSMDPDNVAENTVVEADVIFKHHASCSGENYEKRRFIENLNVLRSGGGWLFRGDNAAAARSVTYSCVESVWNSGGFAEVVRFDLSLPENLANAAVSGAYLGNLSAGTALDNSLGTVPLTINGSSAFLEIVLPESPPTPLTFDFFWNSQAGESGNASFLFRRAISWTNSPDVQNPSNGSIVDGPNVQVTFTDTVHTGNASNYALSVSSLDRSNISERDHIPLRDNETQNLSITSFVEGQEIVVRSACYDVFSNFSGEDILVSRAVSSQARAGIYRAFQEFVAGINAVIPGNTSRLEESLTEDFLHSSLDRDAFADYFEDQKAAAPDFSVSYNASEMIILLDPGVLENNVQENDSAQVSCPMKAGYFADGLQREYRWFFDNMGMIYTGGTWKLRGDGRRTALTVRYYRDKYVYDNDEFKKLSFFAESAEPVDNVSVSGPYLGNLDFDCAQDSSLGTVFLSLADSYKTSVTTFYLPETPDCALDYTFTVSFQNASIPDEVLTYRFAHGLGGAAPVIASPAQAETVGNSMSVTFTPGDESAAFSEYLLGVNDAAGTPSLTFEEYSLPSDAPKTFVFDVTDYVIGEEIFIYVYVIDMYGNMVGEEIYAIKE